MKDIVRSQAGNNQASRALWTLAATSFGFVVVQLDVTIVNVAMPQIGISMDSDMAGLQWLVNAYTLTFASFSSPVSKSMYVSVPSFLSDFHCT